jgi:hypothetical protein
MADACGAYELAVGDLDQADRFLSARIEHEGWPVKTVNLMRQVIDRLPSYAIDDHGFHLRDRRFPIPRRPSNAAGSSPGLRIVQG